ncbi:ssl1498 family light-harvesting-like protein [Kamptonema sp. UHCC 0994]|uniref:photosystem II assembly protein Psb34 n=1 Tax=Kamptonema sp. UHCC 0994 TaxID=3031329 RepID=UPI0023BB0A8C|nr:ssl1498 family light-harvesting-like protein [Kamptonema sp. UHCC 0994]MDF0557023.1 ssl1498 family light-harvesting-like protein [Kamptonema sp. UHCC 0994]
MPYIEEEGGRLNNFAKEPKMYQAEAPNQSQLRNYIIQAIAGAVLVGVLIFVASTV